MTGANFFSRNRALSSEPDLHADSSRGGLEPQQALLLARVRRARGAAVSYTELREAGIEFPASVASELELAGLPIEHCCARAADNLRAAGVRLDPARERAPTDAVARAPRMAGIGITEAMAESGAAVERARRTLSSEGVPPSGARVSSGGRAGANVGRTAEHRPRGRVLAPLALLATGCTVAAIALTAIGQSGAPHQTVAHRHRTLAVVRNAAHPTAAHNVRTPPSAPAHRSPPATPVSLALATNLEANGHDLLAAGQYADAVPVLRRAVQATGERLTACREPETESCLTYAYALYDLGRAVQLSGHPAAAVPILLKRAQIDNQRPIVEAELQLAQQQAR